MTTSVLPVTECWPSVYIADRSGPICFRHAGDGRYEYVDRVVAQLLAKPAPSAAARARR